MWSLSMPVVRIGLAPGGVTLVHMSRWGRQRIDRIEHLPCKDAATDGPVQSGAEPSSQGPWRAACEALEQWLDQQQGQRHRMAIVLSDRFVRWQILPWRIELSGAAELTAYAALRFRETYGRVAQDWSILKANIAPGQPAPAAAVDTGLLETLMKSCTAAGSQLHSVAPYYACAFDHWRSSTPTQDCWFGSVGEQALTIGRLQQGHWAALQTQRLTSDWPALLQTLKTQISLACALPDEAIPLYLCGDLEPPLPLRNLPFTWLIPKRIPQGAIAGVRLALGC